MEKRVMYLSKYDSWTCTCGREIFKSLENITNSFLVLEFFYVEGDILGLYLKDDVFLLMVKYFNVHVLKNLYQDVA